MSHRDPMLSSFALLDDPVSAGTDQRPRSRLYTELMQIHRAHDEDGMNRLWEAVAQDQVKGWHAVMLADYEFGEVLQGSASSPPLTGALTVLMFKALVHLHADEVEAWLMRQDQQQSEPSVAGLLALEADTSEAAFHRAIDVIQQAIRDGETYQVNFTYRLQTQSYGSPVGLYRRLRRHQPVSYGAFIAWPSTDGGHVTAAHETSLHYVLSRSPELFIQHQQGKLTAKPMKGTAPRPMGDTSAAAQDLHNDPKNRAENVMIVDLLRNDLGRIAQVGSVQVPALFEVETYATVLQMTSTIEAQIRPDVSLSDVLKAVFPCGSITGAPKKHTMSLIRRLEASPRGLYCGAIGWLDAPQHPQMLGDFCWSVAIRTLTLGLPTQQGTRPTTLGVGAGIVLDSQAADEYAECQLKSTFATRIDPGFELFETMRFDPQHGISRWTAHLQRLAASARQLGFAFDAQSVQDHMSLMVSELQRSYPQSAARVKLSLQHDGHVHVQHAPLAPLLSPSVRIRLATAPLTPTVLQSHKTTARQVYDEGIRQAEEEGCFDTIFFDPQDRVIEGGRTNVFACLNGVWCTPPLAVGALPGVMRAEILTDPLRQIQERHITRSEFLQASEWMVCNALRGAVPAQLLLS